MDIHAYPTDAKIPVDLAEAQRIADRHLSDPRDPAAGITRVVTEFDTGYTVSAVRGTVSPILGSVPQPTVGGSVCVIDKSTGAVSYWPTYPNAVVAERYSEMLRTGRLVVAQEWPDPDRPEEAGTVDEPATEEIVIDYGAFGDR